MTNPRMNSTAIHTLLKRAGLKPHEYRASRIAGWGDSSTGYELEMGKTTEYICRYCGGGGTSGGHRLDPATGRYGTDRCTSANSGWYQRSTPTGTATIRMSQGTHRLYSSPEYVERMHEDERTMLAVLASAGYSISAPSEGLNPVYTISIEGGQRSARSKTGKVRNVKAMSEDKLYKLLQAVQDEDNDPEARSAVEAEAVGRGWSV